MLLHAFHHLDAAIRDQPVDEVNVGPFMKRVIHRHLPDRGSACTKHLALHDEGHRHVGRHEHMRLQPGGGSVRADSESDAFVSVRCFSFDVGVSECTSSLLPRCQHLGRRRPWRPTRAPLIPEETRLSADHHHLDHHHHHPRTARHRPRALKEPVGLRDSSFTYVCGQPTCTPNLAQCTKGVAPSP